MAKCERLWAEAVLSAVACEDFGYAAQNTWNEGKDHARTSRLLDGAMKAGANDTRASLGASDAFADFMRSPEGRRWRPAVTDPD